MHEHDKKHTEEIQQEGAVAVLEKPKLTGAWDMLKQNYELWKHHWRIFTGIQIIWAAVALAVLVIGLLIAGISLFSQGAAIQAADGQAAFGSFLLARPVLIAGIVMLAIAMCAAWLVALTWMNLAMARSWQWVKKEEHFNMSIRNAYVSTWDLVPGFIWATILSTILVVIGFIGFVIPGILLSIALSLMTFVMISEKARGKELIMRTTRLAHPYLLPIFWRGLVANVVVFLPGQIGAWIINQIFDGVGDLLNQIYTIIFGPIVIGVMYATYLEIKDAERKKPHWEWLSLERIAMIGAVVMAVTVGLILILR